MARVYYRCVFDDAVLRVPGWLKAFCDQRTREELRATYGRWVHAAGADEEDERPPLQKEHVLAFQREAQAVAVLRRRGGADPFSVREPARGLATCARTAQQAARHWTTCDAVARGVVHDGHVVAHVARGPASGRRVSP